MLFELQIPKQAKWITQDKDGQWFWWDKDTKPKPDLGGIWNNYDAREAGGHIHDYYDANEKWGCDFLAKGTPPKNWKQEIYEIYYE